MAKAEESGNLPRSRSNIAGTVNQNPSGQNVAPLSISVTAALLARTCASVSPRGESVILAPCRTCSAPTVLTTSTTAAGLAACTKSHIPKATDVKISRELTRQPNQQEQRRRWCRGGSRYDGSSMTY